MVHALRDSLMKRFLGIFTRVNMGTSFSAVPSKDPFSDRVYAAAAVLDPNQKLLWVAEEVHIRTDLDADEDDQNELEAVKNSLTGDF